MGLIMMVSLPLFAKHVDPTTAHKAAATFLKNNGAKATNLTDISKEANFANLYIFNGEEGFVVMSADDCLKPILGYSLTGKVQVQDMPDNIRGWLQSYNNEIQYAIENQMKTSAETTKLWKDLVEGNNKAAMSTAIVAPLIQTQWDQNGYGNVYLFNNLCPEVTTGGHGGHAYTGCVATAMAQIMKYWEYPSHGMGSHSYSWNGQTLSADFGSTTYDWDNMTYTYSESSTDVEKYAVDLLMYHCGVSVNMIYGGNGSSASTTSTMTALKNYFNYSPAMEYKAKSNYSNDDWIAIVKAELDAERPLQYRGEDEGGHSFICDGYDSNNMFHFNWGWAGWCDGFYSLDNLETTDPGTGGGNGIYTNYQAAIFGIQPVQCAASAPTDLTYTLSGLQNLTLTWTAANGATSYKIYRNNNYVGDSNTNSYNDTAPFGTSEYYVRSVDSNGAFSLASNSVTITIDYPTPMVNDLQAVLSGNNANLSWTAPEWCYPETPSDVLTYGDGTYYNRLGFQGTATMYWGHRYLASDLNENMILYKISFYAIDPGVYEYFIYQGTNTNGSEVKPALQIANDSFVVSFDGWFEIDLSETIEIDNNQDLWIFIYDPEMKGYPAAFGVFSDHENGSYFSSNDPSSSRPNTYNGIAWLIRAYLSDGTYTYNLYQDGTLIAENINGTNYNATLNDNAANLFTVKTNFYDGETEASNMIGFTKGTTSITSLELGTHDNMTITENSALTVTGSITNADPGNLIIEDGAQLIHPNSTATATLKKTILPYTEEVNDGWYTIASPVDGLSVDVATEGNYDLYAYDEKNVLWLNQKNTTNNITDFEEGMGFLYANATEKSLAFAGNMKATDEQINVPLSFQSGKETMKGFNLVGNPFTRDLNSGDITIGGESLTAYYVAESDSQLEVHILAETPIKPGQGFLVQATTTEQNLTFNPSSSKGRAEAKPAYISIEVGNESFTDRAYIQFKQGNTLHKMTLNDNTFKLSARYNDADYAAVTLEKPEGEMPIIFKANNDGQYTLNITLNNCNPDYLHLIDNITGADIDLLTTPSYSFEAKANEYESRFRIIFNASATDNDDEQFAYYHHGQIIVPNMDPESTLQIIDMTGRIVNNNHLTPGVYVLRLISENNIKTQKIIIK